MREVIPPALDGERLDRVVALVGDISRATAAALVDAGEVTVAGQVVTTRSHRVSAGDELSLTPPEPPSGEPEPDPEVPVPVVHEDRDVVVVDKPAGLVVHPGAGRTTGTLVNGLLARYPEIAEVGEPDRPGIVHRLDKGTSGLLLVARTAEAHRALVAMLSAREVTRRYRALVWGRVDAAEGMVDAPIGRAARDRTRMSVTMRGRPAVTGYRVQRRYDHPTEITELVLDLKTGRTHQIRVHMTSIGHPVVGDQRYGGDRPSTLAMGRPWLHAEHLAFTHPTTGQELSFTSALPDDLVTVRARLA